MAAGVHSVHAPHSMRSWYPHERLESRVSFWHTYPTSIVSAFEQHQGEAGRRWSRRYRAQVWAEGRIPVCAREWLTHIYRLPLPSGNWYQQVDMWLKPLLQHRSMLRTEEIYAVGERFVFHSQRDEYDTRDTCIRHMWVEGYHALPEIDGMPQATKAAQIYQLLLAQQTQEHVRHPWGWYVFVLHANQHWRLLMVHHREKDHVSHCSVFFDSLGSRWNPSVDDWPLPVHHVSTHATQRDGISCGYQVLTCLAHVYSAYRSGNEIVEWTYDSDIWNNEDLEHYRSVFFEEAGSCVCETLQSMAVESWMLDQLRSNGLAVPALPRTLPVSWYQAVIQYWMQVYGGHTEEQQEAKTKDTCLNPCGNV
jgi:hypothetical protein